MSRVSVIIATHSRPHLLPRAIESARKASEDAEIIVVDDASIDATAEVCRRLQGIRYIRLDQNLGVAGARNVGILASSAEYISFLDDDDIRLPKSLDLQLGLLDASPAAGLAYGQVILGDPDCVPTSGIEPAHTPSGDIFWDLLSRTFIICVSVVFRKACLQRVGLLNTELSGLDDWDLWVRLCELYSVVAVEKPVAIWRNATPSSLQGSSDSADHMLRIVRHQLDLFCLRRVVAAPASKRAEARRCLLNFASDWLIWQAAAWLPKGESRYARKNVMTALQLNPIRATRPWTFKLLVQSFLSRQVGTPRSEEWLASRD
jgi:hypothetical protein